MAVRNFDLKFGAEFLESLPGSPGVYLVYDQQDELIYVGKAKNLKRRLLQYRNTLRRKKHRRMRGIVREAARIEIQFYLSALALVERRVSRSQRSPARLVSLDTSSASK
jgi:excinuclease UvrABC nuclease subunit